MNISNVTSQQRDFFATGATTCVDFRTRQLQTLLDTLQENESAISAAVYDDLGKSDFAVYMSELSLIYSELRYFIKNIRRLSKKQRVSTNLGNQPARSYIIPEPLGNVLVIGAWNYPIQLSLLPALSALAAGNTVILKPSEVAPASSKILARIINRTFDSEYFHVIEGGVSITTSLLEQRFDKIFFTGSTTVGKIVYQAAAKHLTPITLELGGKSPVFVFADCDIAMTAKRLVWAKLLNAGQTCVAPDYVMVEQSVKTELLAAIKKELQQCYGDELTLIDSMARIINDSHYQRICGLIDTQKIYCTGGSVDIAPCPQQRLIPPTVLTDVTFDDAIMKEEIFGPVLPVIDFTDIDDAIALVKTLEKPLSCSIYSRETKRIEHILTRLSFGSGAVNDSMMQISNHHLPFGGVGHSGMGRYHGKYGFECFSHYKSILHKSTWFESSIKYLPFTPLKKKLIRWLMG